MAANQLAQGGLRTERYGLDKVFHFKDCLLSVPHQPEDDGVHIDWNCVTREGGLGANSSNAHPLIHISAERVEDRNEQQDARTAELPETAKPQDSDFLPL